MGKADFPAIYQGIKSQLNTITCKISYFSDDYDPSKNYAGIIVYGIKGKATWKNNNGQARGYDGRAFYIIILDTQTFPPDRGAGHGRVHHYPLEQVLGYDLNHKSDILCGGFAYYQGKLLFNSVWLNMNDQQGFDGSYVANDGSKEMSQAEKVLVRFCWNEYKKRGKHAIFNIPSEIETKIIGHDVKHSAPVMGQMGKHSSGGNSSGANSPGIHSSRKRTSCWYSFFERLCCGCLFCRCKFCGN